MKNKKGQLSTTNTVIAAIMGIIMLSIIITMVNTSSATERVINETVTNMTNETTRTLDNNPVVANSFALVNSSGTIINTGNYTIDLTLGTIQMEGQSFEAQDGLLTYRYEPVGFIRAGLTRTVVGFVAVFVALAILIAVIKRREE